MMSKFKHIRGAFIDLIGDTGSYTEPEKFLINNPSKASSELQFLTTVYQNTVDRISEKLNYLARLEELILQIRAMEDLSEIKLSIVRGEYIYARSPFLRIDSSTKDLRVIVGKIEEFGKNLEELEKNPIFILKAKLKLIKSMKNMIVKTAAALPGLGDLSTNLYKDDNDNRIDYPLSSPNFN